MSKASALTERIASAAGYSGETVERMLGDYGLNLAAVSRHHRSLRLDRLRVRGAKTGEVEPGRFDETFTFDLGVTVISADNLRGKTSILEVVTLVLRGELRNLQADVLSWLAEISLDVHINGQPVGFRLSLAGIRGHSRPDPRRHGRGAGRKRRRAGQRRHGTGPRADQRRVGRAGRHFHDDPARSRGDAGLQQAPQ